jgi:hypothetical protein
LFHNQTWILVPWPLDPSIVGCKWVNKCKYKYDMTLDRYKARLVVEGFIQVERIDYNETLFLVVKITSLQVFFFFTISCPSTWCSKYIFIHGHLMKFIWNNPLVTCLYKMKIKFVSFWKSFIDWSKVQDFGMRDLIFIYLN